MNGNSLYESNLKWKPTAQLGIFLYLGYLAIFFGTWYINKVDYPRIGESIETIRLWYAYPTLFGSAFLLVALSVLGWWPIVMFDKVKSGPKWVWIFPIAMTLVIIHAFSQLNFSNISAELWLWTLLGALGVGFGEEVINRGGLIVGFRSGFNEIKVWLFSTLLFSAMHVPNVLAGLPMERMPIQVLFTFIIGSGFYVVRRVSGTLIIPILLHGLWDSSIFITSATGGTPSAFSLLMYPLAIVCIIVVLRKNKSLS
jgi:membrane protease YdiL (CAAX protease family)